MRARLLAALALAGALAGALVWLRAHGLGLPGPEPLGARAPLARLDPAAPLRLLALGTSLTARGDWPERLAARLQACRPGPVVVERLARPGANSAWGAAALAARLERGPRPDAVLVEFSINDASLRRGLSLRESAAQHRRILAALGPAARPVWLVTMSPAFGLKGLARPGQRAYRALYAALSAESGAGLVASAPGFVEGSASLLPDGLHPTGAAMAARLLPALEAALRPALCAGAAAQKT